MADEQATRAAGPLTYALLAPWIISGASRGALVHVAKELAQALKASRIPSEASTSFELEEVEKLVRLLGADAGLADRASLVAPSLFTSDFENAIGHSFRLGEAWLRRSGTRRSLPSSVRERIERLCTKETFGMEDLQDWERFLAQPNVYSLPVEGEFGAKSVRLVKGAVDDERADVWIVSGVPSRTGGIGQRDMITGGALRGLEARFGSVRKAKWRLMNAINPRSAYWPDDDCEYPTLRVYDDRSGVWWMPDPWAAKPGTKAPCRHLLFLSTPPLLEHSPEEGTPGVLESFMRALVAALTALSTRGGAGDEEVKSVRMTIVTGRQMLRKEAAVRARLLEKLVRSAHEMLSRSPVIERLDIAFYSPEERVWLDEAWKEFLARDLGDEAKATDPGLLELAKLHRDRCADSVRRLLKATGGSRLLEPCRELEQMLGRNPPPSIRDLGYYTRRVVEGIVGDLCIRYGMKTNGTLEVDIEQLAKRGRHARWFLSYLHTLRTLGNEVVHVSSREVSPKTLEVADEVVLLAALERVLSIRRSNVQ